MTNVTALKAFTVVSVCQPFLEKDVHVISHNENGVGMTNQRKREKSDGQLWRNSNSEFNLKYTTMGKNNDKQFIITLSYRQQTAIMVDSISHVCDSLKNGDRYEAGYADGVKAMRNRKLEQGYEKIR